MNIYDYIGKSSKSRHLAAVFTRPLLIIELKQMDKYKMLEIRYAKTKHIYRSILQLIIGTSVIFSLVNIIREHRLTALALATGISVLSFLIIGIVKNIHLTLIRRSPGFLVFAESALSFVGEIHSWHDMNDRLESISLEDNLLSLSYSLLKPSARRIHQIEIPIPSDNYDEVKNLVIFYQQQISGSGYPSQEL